MQVTIADNNKAEVIIQTTHEHPFAVEGKGWVPAKKLAIGDRTIDVNGNFGTISDVRPVEGLTTVHNFAVDADHTYFVSDAGISGGHMERSGLKALIADIEAGRVDVIVVYKVDRLTRSLTDFSKLVEVFDSNEVSFVSVTQAFNTTNSMGRLTLNVLLSFAQFEREVTGERIRDKIALSRKRGLWTGGLPPLGYDAIDKKLIINEAEAQSVLHIFERYTNLKNVRLLKAELTKDGYVSKRRITKTGKPTGGKPFERGALYSILKNRTYLGLTTHKGEAFDGEHEPIIDKTLFDKVQTILSANRRKNLHKTGARNPSLLAGKIIAPSGIILTPSHAQTKGRRYRYYVERRVDCASATFKPTIRPIRLPAPEIEMSVRESLAAFLSDSIGLMDSLGLSDAPQDTQQEIRDKAQGLADRIRKSALHPDDKDMIMQITKSIGLDTKAKGYRLYMSLKAIADMLGVFYQDDLADPCVDVSLKLQTCNNGKKVIIGNTPVQVPVHNAVLIDALTSAHQIKEQFMVVDPDSMTSIADSLNIDIRQAWRTLKLAFLAPDIQLAILSGTQPRGLLLKDMIYQAIPTGWSEQRKLLGFAA